MPRLQCTKYVLVRNKIKAHELRLPCRILFPEVSSYLEINREIRINRSLVLVKNNVVDGAIGLECNQ